MLTAHSLCWLCQMPLAVARWDLLPLQPRPARLSPALPAVRPAGGGIPSPLRPLPAKAASLASAGGGQ